MALTYTRAPQVSIGDKITSAQWNQLADAFNDRFLGGVGDPTYRLHWFAHSLFRGLRNPDYPNFPAEDEWWKFYSHISDQSTDWPEAAAGTEEGINVTNPMGAFVFGNENPSWDIYNEPDRLNYDAVTGEGIMLHNPNAPTTDWERWIIAKFQRGVTDSTGTDNDQANALVAAAEHFRIRQGGAGWGFLHASYGGMMPAGAYNGPCADNVTEDIDLKITKYSVDPNVECYYSRCAEGSGSGSCPNTSKPVLAWGRDGKNIYLLHFDNTITTLPLSEYLEGVYDGAFDNAFLRRRDGGQLSRALNWYANDFRGDATERGDDDWLVEDTAFDFQNFFERQYYLAPSYGESDGEGGLEADYPRFTWANSDPAGTYGSIDGGTTYNIHSGFVCIGFIAYGTDIPTLETRKFVLVVDGEDVADLTISSEVTSATKILEVPRAGTIRIRCDDDVHHEDETLIAEIAEVWEMKPQNEDAYLLLRMCSLDGTGTEGNGSETDSPKFFSDAYFRYGMILNERPIPYHVTPTGKVQFWYECPNTSNLFKYGFRVSSWEWNGASWDLLDQEETGDFIDGPNGIARINFESTYSISANNVKMTVEYCGDGGGTKAYGDWIDFEGNDEESSLTNTKLLDGDNFVKQCVRRDSRAGDAEHPEWTYFEAGNGQVEFTYVCGHDGGLDPLHLKLVLYKYNGTSWVVHDEFIQNPISSGETATIKATATFPVQGYAVRAQAYYHEGDESWTAIGSADESSSAFNQLLDGGNPVVAYTRTDTDQVTAGTASWTYGGITYGEGAMQSNDTYLNRNAVYWAARSMYHDRLRMIQRNLLKGYEVSGGKSILYFDREAFGYSGADAFAGIGPSTADIASGEIRPGVIYRVNSGTTGITYNSVSVTVGNTFTGVYGETTFTKTSGDEVVKEHDGIIATPPEQGTDNRWSMFLSTTTYKPSDSSEYKLDNYGDVQGWGVDRCAVFGYDWIGQEPSTLDEAREINRHVSPGGTNVMQRPEIPSGYRYLLGTQTPPVGTGGVTPSLIEDQNSVDCDDGNGNPFDDTECKGIKDHYSSCQVYVPDYEVEACEWVDADTVKVTLTGRLRKNSSAPSAVTNSSAGWDTYLSTESGPRSDENAVVEYLRYQEGSGGQCVQRIGDFAGDHRTGSGWDGTVVNGSCIPRFYFTRLIPKVYEDGNDVYDLTDTRMITDETVWLETVLRAICEGYIDESSTNALRKYFNPITLRHDCYSKRLFDFSFESLMLAANDNQWTRLLPEDRREDNPRMFGPFPNVIAYAEHFNQISRAVNKLTRARLDLPVEVEWRFLNYSDHAPFEPQGSGGCVSGTVWADGVTGPSSATLVSTGSWQSDIENIILRASVETRLDDDDGNCGVTTTRQDVQYQLKLATVADNALPEDLKTLVVTNTGSGFAAAYDTEITSHTRIVETPGNGYTCGGSEASYYNELDQPQDWVPSTTITTVCVVANSGVLQAPPPQGTDHAGTKDSSCGVGFDSSAVLAVENIEGFVRVPLV